MYVVCQVIEGCLQACHTFTGLSNGAQGLLEQEVALLHIQANLVDIAESLPGTAATRQSLAVAKGVQQLRFQITSAVLNCCDLAMPD